MRGGPQSAAPMGHRARGAGHPCQAAEDLKHQVRMTRRRSLRDFGSWLLLCSLGGCVRAEDAVEPVGVTITGLDHLAEHLSIQDFWVNGTSGHQAGKGGRKVCCVQVPGRWRPGIYLQVRWAVTNWKRRVYGYHEARVEVEPYGEEIGPLWVHFLPDGSVRAVVSMYAAWGRDGYYPGPSYDTVLTRKQPWTDYKGSPDEPLFTEVTDPMKD